MKKVLLLALGIVFSASLAFGQAGYIGLYTDLVHTNCNMTINDAGGTKRIYVYHLLAVGTTASMFGIKSTGFTGDPDTECELVGITYQFTSVVGDPFFEPPYDDDNAGAAFSYGSCNATGTIYLCRINFSCVGDVVPPACSKFEPVPAPDAPSGTIEVTDCAEQKLVSSGQMLTVNGNETCDCEMWVPVQSSTWGKVKALYE